MGPNSGFQAHPFIYEEDLCCSARVVRRALSVASSSSAICAGTVCTRATMTLGMTSPGSNMGLVQANAWTFLYMYMLCVYVYKKAQSRAYTVCYAHR